MKRLSIFAFLLVVVLSITAQQQVQLQQIQFLNEKGVVNTRATQLGDTAMLENTSHRADDVIWSRTVYRIIDMRYKQNYQLYFPRSTDNPNDRSLFKVIVDAIVDGLDVYSAKRVKPIWADSVIMSKGDISTRFAIVEEGQDLYKDDQCIQYDSVTDKLVYFDRAFEPFAAEQLKYLIQEVVFFDKHTSRLYSRIVGIAPLHSGLLKGTEEPKDALFNSILCWIPFNDLRPYLAKQYIISESSNNMQRVTYDEFFRKKMYSSYLVGIDNVRDRLILDYAKTAEEVRREQQKIEDALLNFEQDLWEY